MGFEKQIKNELTEQGGKVAKAMMVQFFIYITIILQIGVVILSINGSFFPGGDAMTDIVGTCGEIIAGLYGITLAGYTFFLSRMDALMSSDMTLDYIVKSVKTKYKYIIWYITFNVLMTLFICISLMYWTAPSGDIQSFIYRLFCNEFVIFLGMSIIMILYYSVSVVEPNSLEKEAARLKKKISRSRGKEGDVIAFIAMYDSIEEKCNAMLPEKVLQQLHDNKGKHFELTIELLYETRPSLRPMIVDLKRIHRYYECVVNCSPMSVSQEMCDVAQRVLTYLENN